MENRDGNKQIIETLDCNNIDQNKICKFASYRSKICDLLLSHKGNNKWEIRGAHKDNHIFFPLPLLWETSFITIFNRLKKHFPHNFPKNWHESTITASNCEHCINQIQNATRSGSFGTYFAENLKDRKLLPPHLFQNVYKNINVKNYKISIIDNGSSIELLEKEFIGKLLIVIDKDEIFIFFKLYNKTDNFYHIHLLKETRFKSLSIDSKKNLGGCLISGSKNANGIKLFLSHSSGKFGSIKSQETLNPILTKQITEVLQNKNLGTIETYIGDLTEPLTITN